MTSLTYEQQLAELWRAALDPKSVGLLQALAQDIASYTGQEVDDVLQLMDRGKTDFKELWVASKIDPADRRSVEGFYRDQFVEAYELADWHAGRTNGDPPLTYPHAARVAREKGLRRVLDFGSGIGSGALCLKSVGCEVDCADIARRLLDFVQHRCAQHDMTVGVIDLGAGERPKHGYYDLITCFDVLEHIPDQHAELIRLGSYLRPGGYIVLNLMNDSRDEDRPMHISSAENWVSLVRRTPLVPDWQCCYLPLGAITLVKKRGGALQNVVASLVDRWQAARADAR